MSPKAAFRLKKWFDKFGLADELAQLEFDDDTNLLLDPDLVGVDVIFEVYEDPKLYQGERQVRTRLVEVLDEAATPAPAPVAPAKVPKAVAGASVSPQARAAAARPAPVAAPVEADEEVEEEEAEEPAPVAAAPVAARRFSRSSAAATTGPARRQLR